MRQPLCFEKQLLHKIFEHLGLFAGEPPEDWYEGNFGPEAACCLSLLERHAGTACGAPEAVQRTLIKAGEEGGKAYETACAELHREWAERLRRGEPLPAVSRRYFGE